MNVCNSEYATPLGFVNSSGFPSFDSRDDCQSMVEGRLIIPPSLLRKFFNTDNYTNKFYEFDGDNVLCDSPKSQVSCRYYHLYDIGYICPCCEPRYNQWDSIPRPEFINQDYYGLFYMPKENDIFYSNPKVYLGTNLCEKNKFVAKNGQVAAEATEIHYYSNKHIVAVTGHSCTYKNKTGFNLLIPDRHLTEEEALIYQKVINILYF